MIIVKESQQGASKFRSIGSQLTGERTNVRTEWKRCVDSFVKRYSRHVVEGSFVRWSNTFPMVRTWHGNISKVKYSTGHSVSC